MVIPVFNESRRVGNLTRVFEYLDRQKFEWELIIVNDGSTDDTERKLKKWIKKVKLINYPVNRGKGYAVKTGMKNTKGKFCLFLDMDMSTPISEFDKFLPILGKGDVWVGVRRHPKSQVLVHQPPLRELLGQGFTRLSQAITGQNISDFTCGFKCFNRKAADMIFSRVQVDRWGFDTEVLWLAKYCGLTVTEVPVVWRNDSLTKVKLGRDVVNSLGDLMNILFNRLTGKYSPVIHPSVIGAKRGQRGTKV